MQFKLFDAAFIGSLLFVAPFLQLEYRMAFDVVRSKNLVATVKHYGTLLHYSLGQVVIPLENLQEDGQEIEDFYPLKKVLFQQ